MHEAGAEPPDHRTGSAGLETGEACQRTSPSPQLLGGGGRSAHTRSVECWGRTLRPACAPGCPSCVSSAAPARTLRPPARLRSAPVDACGAELHGRVASDGVPGLVRQDAAPEGTGGRPLRAMEGGPNGLSVACCGGGRGHTPQEKVGDPSPPQDQSDHRGGTTKFTIGKILSGHFWYTNFWVPDPPFPAPNTPSNATLAGMAPCSTAGVQCRVSECLACFGEGSSKGGLWALGYPSRTEEGLTGPRVAPPGKPGAGAPHTHPSHAAGGRGAHLLVRSCMCCCPCWDGGVLQAGGAIRTLSLFFLLWHAVSDGQLSPNPDIA